MDAVYNHTVLLLGEGQHTIAARNWRMLRECQAAEAQHTVADEALSRLDRLLLPESRQ